MTRRRNCRPLNPLPSGRRSHPRLRRAFAPFAVGDARRAVVASLVLAAVPIALAAASRLDWAVLAPDSFAYLETARRLHEDGRFADHRVMTPPGLAVLIAPLFAWGDPPLTAIRALLTAGWAASAVLTFLIFRRRLGRRLAGVAGLLTALSPVVLYHSTAVLSETVFTALSFGALLLLERWSDRERVHPLERACGGALIGAAILVRSTGWVLVPTAVIALAGASGGDEPRALNGRNRRRWWNAFLGAARRSPADGAVKQAAQVLDRAPAPNAARRGRAMGVAIVVGCASLLPAAWAMRDGRLGEGPNYARTWLHARAAEETSASGIALQFERLARFGPLRLADVQGALVPTRIGWRLFRPPLSGPMAWLIGGSLVAGAIAAAAARRRPIFIYICLYMGMLALWPWDEGPRLVAPIAPLFIGLALAGLARAGRALNRGAAPAIGVAAAAIVLVQAAEMRLCLRAQPARRARALGELAEMAALAGRQQALSPAGRRCVAVAPDGFDRKRIALGGAYFAGWTCEAVDVRGGARAELPAQPADCIVVHESFYNDLVSRIQTAQRERFGEFLILTPASQAVTVRAASGSCE